MFGLERALGARLVTYADDLVILCRRGKAEAALQSLREIMGKLKLTVSEEKTRLIEFGRFAAANRERRGLGKPETFNFLGFSVLQRHGKEFCMNV